MSKLKQQKIVGLRELRENLSTYLKAVQNGSIFTIVRRSKPIFNITPVDDKEMIWEEVVDFTKIKKGGVKIADILGRL